MRELVSDLITALKQGRECVFCSVVETRGSTPQKAGAAMLVLSDGSQSGTLGGGCIEAEMKQRALRVLGTTEGRPEMLSFCLDDNYGWDDGLICGGRMTILADPITCQKARLKEVSNYYNTYQDLIERGEGCTEAIVMKDPKKRNCGVGSRYLFDPTNLLKGQIDLGTTNAVECNDIMEKIRQSLKPVKERPQPAVHHGIAYLPILPRVSLLIVGGGHVGQAVARLASDVDFDIWVIDDRQSYASRERFPMANRLLVGDIGSTLKQLVQKDIGVSTYCIIVTRGHNHDEEALYHLASSPAGYVGMIGSKRKIKLIYEDLIAKNISKDALSKVHAPLGLSIGSQTVPEIAISIVAELVAHRNLGGGVGARPDRTAAQL